MLGTSVSGTVETVRFHAQSDGSAQSLPAAVDSEPAPESEGGLRAGADSAAKGLAFLKESTKLAAVSLTNIKADAQQLSLQMAQTHSEILQILDKLSADCMGGISLLRKQLAQSAHEDQNEKLQMYREYQLLSTDTRQFWHLLTTTEKKLEALAQFV